MDIPRLFSAGVLLNDHVWWITGGEKKPNAMEGTDTSLIYDMRNGNIKIFFSFSTKM